MTVVRGRVQMRHRVVGDADVGGRHAVLQAITREDHPAGLPGLPDASLIHAKNHVSKRLPSNLHCIVSRIQGVESSRVALSIQPLSSTENRQRCAARYAKFASATVWRPLEAGPVRP